MFNVVVFVCMIVVLIQIRHARNQDSIRKKTDSKTVIRLMFTIGGVMFIFGLTWLFAILTVSVPGLRETFQILFAVFSSLQGVFIFLFTNIINSEARQQWMNTVMVVACRKSCCHPIEAQQLSKSAVYRNPNFIGPTSGIPNAVILQNNTTYCDQKIAVSYTHLTLPTKRIV